MSTYVYFECLEHDPPLQSDGEISQHWDSYVDTAIRMAQGVEPLPADPYELHDQFLLSAAVFLRFHELCAVGLVSEYGEHRPIEGRGAERQRAAAERQLLRARERYDVATREQRDAAADITAAKGYLHQLDSEVS